MKKEKKYRNTITFTERNNTRIRIRQKNASFSQTVNEDLTAYYDLLDCLSINMRNFFNQPRKLQYYCAAIYEMEVYKRKHAIAYAIRVRKEGVFKPWSYAYEISWALEEGARKRLDVIWRVDGKALAEEARALNVAEALWVYDWVEKSLKNGYQQAK